jgi:hypothetical protein
MCSKANNNIIKKKYLGTNYTCFNIDYLKGSAIDHSKGLEQRPAIAVPGLVWKKVGTDAPPGGKEFKVWNSESKWFEQKLLEREAFSLGNTLFPSLDFEFKDLEQLARELSPEYAEALRRLEEKHRKALEALENTGRGKSDKDAVERLKREQKLERDTLEQKTFDHFIQVELTFDHFIQVKYADAGVGYYQPKVLFDMCAPLSLPLPLSFSLFLSLPPVYNVWTHARTRAHTRKLTYVYKN